jgi:hypothetical protein
MLQMYKVIQELMNLVFDKVCRKVLPTYSLNGL